MLKQVAFQNFIHFRERQHLSFKNGPNYIVGGNSTGKSSIFELIRRCLSRGKNASMSSIPDERRIAFTICKFELSTDIATDIADIDALELKGIGEPDTLYTGILIENLVDGRDRKVFKFVYVLNTSSDNVRKVFVESHNFPLSEKFLQMKTEDTDEIADHIEKLLLQTKEANAYDEQLLHLSLSKTSNEKIEGRNEGSTQCEVLLQRLHEYIVNVFPIKSIGPLQWCKSEEIKSDENYDNADKNAEILSELLEAGDVDHAKADRIFKTLTAPSKYTFEKQDGCYYVTYNNRKSRLLKVPDGIIEAKQVSLLLAHKKYKTLCYDQPDLGMHPHMIEKMRDLVLRSESDEKKIKKTIIFISHSPVMINTWTLGRIHICRHVEHEKMFSHRVKKVEDKDVAEILLRHEIKNLLFAPAVIFVEGKDDHLLITSVFDEVLKSGPAYYDEAQQQNLQQIICGIQILEMQGQTSYFKCCKLATMLEIPYIFVEDRDVFFSNETSYIKESRKRMCQLCKEKDLSKRKNNLRDIVREFEKHTDNVDKETKICHTRIKSYLGKDAKNYTPEQLAIELKENNVFYWDSGELEDMLFASVIESKMSEEDRSEMLLELFCAQETGKNTRKNFLLNMAKERVENLSACLKDSREMKQLFDFLLESRQCDTTEIIYSQN